ncbi:hypothetical protein AAFN75_13245 [Algibacter sp. AS12]|uniref:hypothetical protein n=1 Tax=Algibacter sp. AS12 TaxID=3135773 RepID=UPI00398B37DE
MNLSKDEVGLLLETLSSKDDKVWPKTNWPAIRFKDGLNVGAKGGHGIIQYEIEGNIPGDEIVFRFLKPHGFNGIHKFEIKDLGDNTTEVKHSIIMITEGIVATLKWALVIRWLHDALIENAFDTIENNALDKKKHTKWNLWVRIWRFIFSKIR